MDEQEKDDLVERILLDQVPDAEKPAVKKLLAEDEDLREKLRFQLQLRQAVRDRQREQGRAMFQSFEREPPAGRAMPLWGQLAAGVSLLLVAGTLLWLLLRRDGPPDIVQDNQVKGIVQLPFYETEDGSLGLGQDSTADSIVAVFAVRTPAAYAFADTLKVYLPELPRATPPLRVVYARASDTYYLFAGGRRYALVKGRPGLQPLRAE